MPLTKTEQKRFEEMLNKPMAEKSTVEFLNQLGDVLFEFTGNINLKMRLLRLAGRIALL